MAKKIIIDVETKGLKETTNQVDDLNQSTEELKDNANATGAALTKAGTDGQKGLAGISKGFKGIGGAIKAAGIGIVIGLFVLLKEVLEKQQPVLDLVDTTMTAIGLAIKAVGSALSEAFKTASEATGGFDAMKTVIMSLLKIAIAPLQASFYGIKAAVLGAQLAWEKSFLGDGDPKTIKSLQDGLDTVQTDLAELGKSVIDNAVLIKDNIGEAISEVGSLATSVVSELEKVDSAAILSEAKRTTALKNNALIREAINKGLLEQFDRSAEQQRQIRDDETKTFDERIAANDKLGAILEEQQVLMLANADAVEAAAQAEFNANQTTENKVKLIEAQNEKLAILATVEGFRSEQMINQIALQKEKNEAEQKSIRLIDKKTEKQRLASKESIKIAEDTLRTQSEREIQAIKDDAAAKLELLIGNSAIEDKAREAIRLERDAKIKEVEDIERQRNTQNQLDSAATAVGIAQDLSSVLSTITNRRLDDKQAKLDKQAQDEINKNGQVSDATLKQQDALLKEKNKIAKKQFQIDKAFQVAQIGLSTAAAIVSALATPVGGPFLAVAAAATGAASLAAALATKFSPSAGGGSSPSIPTPTLPSTSSASPGGSTSPNDSASFNPQELFAVAAEEVGSGGPGSNQRVFVVESDITDTQSRVSTIESTASIG